MTRELTPLELAALQAFAAASGHYWKKDLRLYWYNARIWTDVRGDPAHGHVLHGLRNDLGPEWLAGFKLPKKPKEGTQ